MGEVARCPECNALFEIGDHLEAGDYTDCDDCGIELKIARLRPVKFEQFVESALNLDDYDDVAEEDI